MRLRPPPDIDQPAQWRDKNEQATDEDAANQDTTRLEELIEKRQRKGPI